MQNSHSGHMAIVKSLWMFASLGCVSQVCQIVLFRELLMLAEGTELTIAFVLGTWLVLIGLGSFAASKLLAAQKRILTPLPIYALLSLSLTAFAVLDIWLIRLSRIYLALPPGEPLSSAQWLFIASVALLPVCVIIGAQFVFAASFAGASGVYIAESLGAVIAGIALSLFLLQLLDHTSLLACSLALHLLLSLWVTLKFQPNMLLTIVLAIVAALTLIASPFVENYTQLRFWRSMFPSGKLVRFSKSPYGLAAVVRYGDQLSVYQGGHLLFTLPDQGEIASLVHLILLQHPRPNRILLIGGLGGWVKAVLEHPKVVGVDWVEVDPTIPKLVLPLLPQRERVWVSDPRIELHFSDGRSFVRQVQRPYDVIIVVASDPTTATANRFFTWEFFAEVAEALLPGGIFALHGLHEPPSGFGEFYLMRNNCVYRTMLTSFCEVLVVPSSPLTLLAKCPAPQESTFAKLTLHEPTLLQRMRERKLGDINLFAFTNPVQVERVNYEVKTGLPFNPLEQEQVKATGHKWLNSDTNPTGYFLSSMFWLRMSGEKGAKLLEVFLNLPRWSIGALAILPLKFWLLIRRRYRIYSASFVAIAVIGAVGMLTELTILLVFQSLLGTLYQQVALLFAIFMLGLAFGAWLVERWRNFRCFLSLMPLALMMGLTALAWCGISLLVSSAPTVIVAILCGLFIALVGCLIGVSFPVAVQVLESFGFEREKAAGLVYSCDLLGGAIGAFLLGAVVLPLWGTTNSLAVCAFSCFFSASIVAYESG